MSSPLHFHPRRAVRFGSQKTSRFVITLSPSYPVFNRDSTPNPSPSTKVLAGFVHEYIHYVQNVSTVSGARSYVVFQSILALFARTLVRSGESLGDVALDPQTRRDLQSLFELLVHWEGHSDLRPVPISAPDSIVVRGYTAAPWTTRRKKGDVSGTDIHLDCHVRCENGHSNCLEYRFGLAAIEEGMSYEIDRMVETGRTHLPSRRRDVPVFPYLVLRAFGEHLFGGPVDTALLLYCASVALASADPPRAFIGAVKLIRTMKGSLDDTSDVAKELGRCFDAKRSWVTDIVEADLDSVISDYHDRGLAETGARRLRDLLVGFIRRRETDPFFELRPFVNGRVDNALLTKVLYQSVPGDVLQELPCKPERASAPMRDVLVGFGPSLVKGGGWDQSTLLRVLELQIDFFLAHCRGHGFIPTKDVLNRTCPFYTACPFALRQKRAGICRTRPWLRYRNSPTCWYGAAVAATIGSLATTQEAWYTRLHHRVFD